MHNEKPLNQSRLQVETDLNTVEEVLQWFEDFTAPLLPQQLQSQCQLAFIEGFTNAVRHAHRHLPQTTPIDLELKLFAHCLEMRIWDHGPLFDLQAKLQEALDHQNDCNPIEPDVLPELAEGGRGLIFMHELTDELSYERLSDDRNCLLLRKRR